MTERFPNNPLGSIQRHIVSQVRAVFNDQAKGERPVERSDRALFARNSVIWRVHSDVTTMMVGGIAALLLQMLHPAALTAVLDHSNFRSDMLGRLRRTAKFIAVTTYADAQIAEAAIDRVRGIHQRVTGSLSDGTPYMASDPRLLAWVHTAEAICFLNAWIAYSQPNMSLSDQDTYFAQAAIVARKLGAGPVPETRAEAQRFIISMRSVLRVSPECHEVARLITSPSISNLGALATQRLLSRAAIDLLPTWARDMLQLGRSGPDSLLTFSATKGMAVALRWAFSSQA